VPSTVSSLCASTFSFSLSLSFYAVTGVFPPYATGFFTTTSSTGVLAI